MNNTFYDKKLSRFINTNVLTKIKRVLHNFHRKIYIRYLRFTKTHKIVEAKLFTNQKMKVALPDYISEAVYVYSYFEPKETKAFIRILKDNDVFIDIGAHIGYYSLLATYFSANSKTFAIEPTPSSYQILKDNVYPYGQIKPLNIGLYSSEGNMILNDFGLRYMCLNSFSEARLSQKLESKKVNVTVITIDKLVKKEKIIPTVIKIDAESSELEIINGGENTLRNNNMVLFVEVGDFANLGFSSSLKIINRLEEFGYEAFEFENVFKKHKKLSIAYPSMSLFFFKSNEA